MGDSLSPVVRIPSLVGRWWKSLTLPVQILLAGLLLFAKSGLDVALRNVQEAYIPASQAFPEPTGYFSASFGQVWLTSALGIETTTQWVALHTALIVAGLAWTVYLVHRMDPASTYLSLPILVSATAVGGMLVSIGMYDVFTIVGGLTLVLARSNWLALIGALVMASGNPEQAILASAALLVLTLLERFRQSRKRAVIGLLVSLASWLAVLAWFHSYGSGSGRLGLLIVNLAGSLGNFISGPESAIWLWFGAGWLIVVVSLLLVRGREIPALVASLLVIPGMASILTTDGWRVFAPIVLPSYVIVGIWLGRDMVAISRYRDAALGSFLICLVAAPMAVQGPQWLRGQITVNVLHLFGL